MVGISLVNLWFQQQCFEHPTQCSFHHRLPTNKESEIMENLNLMRLNVRLFNFLCQKTSKTGNPGAITKHIEKRKQS